MAAISEFLGTGRRKTAVARVRIASGTGKIMVNGRELENYFPTESLRMVVNQPLVVTALTGKYDIRVNVQGGGPFGQGHAEFQQSHGGGREPIVFLGTDDDRQIDEVEVEPE